MEEKTQEVGQFQISCWPEGISWDLFHQVLPSCSYWLENVYGNTQQGQALSLAVKIPDRTSTSHTQVEQAWLSALGLDYSFLLISTLGGSSDGLGNWVPITHLGERDLGAASNSEMQPWAIVDVWGSTREWEHALSLSCSKKKTYNKDTIKALHSEPFQAIRYYSRNS